MLLQRVSFSDMDRSYGVWCDPYVRLPYWKWPCSVVVHMDSGPHPFEASGVVITSYRLNDFGCERYARFYKNVSVASQHRIYRLSHTGKISLNMA